MHPAGLGVSDQNLGHHACPRRICLFHRLGQSGGETGFLCERACRPVRTRGRGRGCRVEKNYPDTGDLYCRGVLARLDGRYPRIAACFAEVAHPRSGRETVAGPDLLVRLSSTSRDRGRHREIVCCRAAIGAGARNSRRGRGSGRV